MRARLDAATTDREHFDAGRAWQRELFDGGWAGIAWPAEYGGRGRDARRRPAIFARGAGAVRGERGVRRRRRSAWSVRCCLRHGTRRATGALPAAAAARGRDVVPAVQRTGRRKRPREPRDPRRCATATSSSSTGRRCGRRTRTSATSRSCSRAPTPTRRSTAGSRSCSLDLRTPGVEVRPLRQITGAAHFNEVFLTDVRVPVENVVGEIDGGWAPARAVLAHEAAVIGGGNAAAAGCAALVELGARARSRNDDPVVRQRLAAAYTREQILRLHEGARAGVGARPASRPGIDGSVMKVLWSEARRDRAELGVALLGARRCARRRVADAAARAVLGHDRRRHERSAPHDDRRARARSPAGAARRPRRVVPRAGGRRA